MKRFIGILYFWIPYSEYTKFSGIQKPAASEHYTTKAFDDEPMNRIPQVQLPDGILEFTMKSLPLKREKWVIKKSSKILNSKVMKGQEGKVP